MVKYKKRRSMSILNMTGSGKHSIKRRGWKPGGIFLGIVLILLLATSCGKPESYATIIGVVYDGDTNEVLENVTVRYSSDIFTTTSPRGVFELTKLPLGKIQLSFEKEGYRPTAREVALKEGKEFLEVLMERAENTAFTLADQVKLRLQPSVDGQIIDALAINTKVILAGEQKLGWYKGKVGEQVGWIWGGYLKSDTVSIPRMEVKIDSKLYSTPDEAAEDVQEIYEGFQVIILETQGDRTKVILPSGVEGWVSSAVLSP